MTHDPVKVLIVMSESGWTFIDGGMIHDVITYIRRFGILRLTRDRTIIEVFRKLEEDEWARITRDEIAIFALEILDIARKGVK